MRELPLKDLPLAVLDFETTGVDPTTCGIVQVALVHTTLGSPDCEVVLNRRCHPGCPVGDSAMIHGISDEDVAGLEPFEPAELDLGGRVIVAYNLPYEYQILRRFIPSLPWFGLDPLVWVKHIDKFKKGKKLSDVCARRGIDLDPHDAAADAVTTARLVHPLLQELWRWSAQRERFRTVDDLWNYQMELGRLAEEDLEAYFVKTGKGPLDSHPWRDL